MNTAAELVSIGELEKEGAILKIQDGNHGEKHPKATDYVDEGIPFIMANNVVGNSVDVANAVKLPQALSDSLRIGFARNGDVLLTHKGTIGGTAIVKTDLPYFMLTPQVTYYRTDENKLINRYLMYAFQEPLFQNTMKSQAQQATRLYIGITAQRRLRVRWMPLAKQDRVVSILSNYDDLIENNRRRIQLLEQVARLLYKEWFVHLRFPGHEHVTITDGVPNGWSRRRLSNLATKIGSGATPRGGSAAYQSEGIALIRSLNVYDYRLEDDGLAYIDDNQAEKLSAVEVEPLDILLNITGASVGRCCMVPDRHLPARVNQHVMIIRINRNECEPHYILHAINSHQQKQNLLSIARSGGATREALTKGVVQSIALTVPPGYLLDQFERTAGILFDQRQILAALNSQLTQARDLLLPRLMNGEVAV